LTELNISKVYSTGSSAFQDCINLETVTIKGYSIAQNTFINCSKLKTVNVLYSYNGQGASSINSNVFANTPIADSTYLGYFGSIYVPSELVNYYKSKAGWSFYSDRITAYEG
jgi:hypothetical protein